MTTRFITVLFLAATIIFSVGVYCVYLFVYDILELEFTYRTIVMLCSTPKFYAIVLLMVSIEFLMTGFYLAWKRNCDTSICSYVQKIVNQEVTREKLLDHSTKAELEQTLRQCFLNLKVRHENNFAGGIPDLPLVERIKIDQQ